jgi:hypothetical protein
MGPMPSCPLRANTVSDYPKHIRRLLREWTAEAYERELKRELARLEQSFLVWRQGRIGSGELSHLVHEYEVGPSRALYQQYNSSRPELSVAYAVVTGILKEEEIPVELLEAIAGPLSFYRLLKERGELKEPGEDIGDYP